MVWGSTKKDRRFQERPTEKAPMLQPKNDLRKSIIRFEQHKTVLAVVELSLRTWLVGGVVSCQALTAIR